MRRRIAGLTAFLVVALPVALIGLDAGVAAATNPVRSSTVVEASPGDASAPEHRTDWATVFLNGLGLDVSLIQAEALTPSVGRFGRVYALKYASVFDADEAADELARAIRTPNTTPAAPVTLTLVASSMGDVRGLEIIAALHQRHPEVRVAGFVVNTGPGPGKRLRVKAGPTVQALLDQSCSPFVPGSVTLGLLEVLNQYGQGNVTSPATLADAFEAGTQYRGRVVVNQLCSLTRPSPLTDPPAVPFSAYLGVADPAADVIVDCEAAYADWKELLPDMQQRRVAGVTHDNLHFRPDVFNRLFAADLMPAVRAAVAPKPSVRGGIGAPRPV